MNEPAIAVSEVTKVYEGGLIHALAGVSVEVGRGEWVALSGPSGCGKSTLLHLIAGLDTPTSGSIVVNGRPLASRSLDAYRLREIGLVFQFHNLLPNFTAFQNVLIAMVGNGLAQKQQRERAHTLLAAVGLSGREQHLPTHLSGGERQRLAIARALANDPPIILADEPTGALDSTATESALELFRAIQVERGLTILMVTHDPHVAHTADRTVFMRDGRVVADATAAHGATASAWSGAGP